MRRIIPSTSTGHSLRRLDCHSMCALAHRRGTPSAGARRMRSAICRARPQNGLKHGATGYLNTEWGDNGHWQTLPINYVGFGMGAAYSWAWEANRAAPVPRVISQFAFDDPSGNFGRVAYDLGEVYRALGVEPHNSSVLFWMLQWPLKEGERRLSRNRVARDTPRNTGCNRSGDVALE